MKKSLVSAALIITSALSGQITLDVAYPTAGSYQAPRYLTKFGQVGYKFFQVNDVTNTITIYNTNNSLYKTINIPSYSASPGGAIGAAGNNIYLSDNLFNTDTLIEYIWCYVDPSNVFKLYVYNELGTPLFFRDSSYLSGGYDSYSIFQRVSAIFYDGSAVKMQIIRGTSQGATKFEIYTLPGSIPCEDCSAAGVLTGLGRSQGKIQQPDAQFYPNPVKDDLKLKYSIPPNTKLAKIKIYDSTGKVIEEYRLSPSTDYILLPSNYNNGLYIYSLEVDGQVVKNEKIILAR